MEIVNNANANYVFDGASVESSVVSNTNSVDLQSSQGLVLNKVANKNYFVAGDIIEYTINITNSSAHYLTGVRIIDDLGGGNLAYVLGSASLTIGSNTYSVNPISTNPLTFTLQQLNVGGSMILKYKAQVIFNLPQSVNTIVNSVKGIGYTSTGTIVGYTNSIIQKKTTVEFDMIKTASVESVYKYEVFNYYLKIVNNSNTGATVSEIIDQLPSGFELINIGFKVGASKFIPLDESDYTLDATNKLIIQSVNGLVIRVESENEITIELKGYFI